MSNELDTEGAEFVPDSRLKDALQEAYREASDLDSGGIEGLCPTYTELRQGTAHYQDESFIGRGGLKEVYRTFDRRAQRWVALARLLEERGPDYYEIFVHEARLVASMNHPNIINVYELGVDAEGRPFFTMDLKGNVSLADVVQDDSRTDALLLAFSKVCDAMGYAHTRGVIHLDLKPENIQCDDFGEVLVCDWGLGARVEPIGDVELELPVPVSEEAELMLMRAQAKGTPGFMAPEQFTADAVMDARTDVYALGCLLYFILTGSAPFEGSREEVEAVMQVTQEVSPKARHPELRISEGLDAIVRKAMSREPELRYANAARLQSDLALYLAGFATRAEQPGWLRRGLLFVGRHRLPVAIITMALCLVGGLTAVYLQDLAEEKRAKLAEAQRASELSTQVDALSDEYTRLAHDSEASNSQVAKEIAESADFLKEMSIYERPVETVDLARVLTNTALRMDPDSVEAKTQAFVLDCLQLNFRSALEYSPDAIEAEAYAQLIDLARAFPKYDYSSRRRPSTEEIVEVFQQAALIRTVEWRFLEALLSYDHAVRQNYDDYDAVLQAFLRVGPRFPEDLVLSYQSEAGTLSLWAKRRVSLNRFNALSEKKDIVLSEARPKHCYLRFLEFHTLNLAIEGRFDLADIHGLPIKVLDLSRCARVELGKRLRLPHLRTVYVAPGQFEPDALQQWIKSKEPFEVIERTP